MRNEVLRANLLLLPCRPLTTAFVRLFVCSSARLLGGSFVRRRGPENRSPPSQLKQGGQEVPSSFTFVGHWLRSLVPVVHLRHCSCSLERVNYTKNIHWLRVRVGLQMGPRSKKLQIKQSYWSRARFWT